MLVPRQLFTGINLQREGHNNTDDGASDDVSVVSAVIVATTEPTEHVQGEDDGSDDEQGPDFNDDGDCLGRHEQQVESSSLPQ